VVVSLLVRNIKQKLNVKNWNASYSREPKSDFCGGTS